MDVRQFSWVANEAKALRAVAQLKKENLPVNEETIKTLYLRYGGLVIGDPTTQKGVEEGDVSFAVLPEEEKEAIVAKQSKKRGSK